MLQAGRQAEAQAGSWELGAQAPMSLRGLLCFGAEGSRGADGSLCTRTEGCVTICRSALVKWLDAVGNRCGAALMLFVRVVTVRWRYAEARHRLGT